MLFDLSGKRRNVIRVVYGFLAVIFGAGFLLFGVGSEVQGGLGDLFGFGTNDTTNDNPAFEDQIDDAEQRLVANPNDERALADLVQLHYQAGNDAVEVNETTGQISFTTESEDSYNAAVSAWQDYQKAAKDPDPATAAIANQAYTIILQNAEPTEVETIAKDAIAPAEISAEDNPGVGPYSTLAQYAYFAGDTELGGEAARKAVAEAEPSQRNQIQKGLDQAAKAAEQLREQIEKQAEKGGDEGAFTNPLEQGIGGGSLPGAGGTALPGGAPPAP
jgi:hypothetical protein